MAAVTGGVTLRGVIVRTTGTGHDPVEEPDTKVVIGVLPAPDAGGPTWITAPDDDEHVGLVTRAVSWTLDALLLVLGATIAGLGIELFFSIIPLSGNVATVLKPIAAAAFVLWCAAYFVAFWSTTGQTPGARMMQVRLVTANRARVKPARAFVRWAAMNLAALTLGVGFVPILFGRRGFPDWAAHTVVINASQRSVAEARLATVRAARGRSERRERSRRR